MLKTEPEVRIFLNHLRIIADGSTQVACLLQQQGTIEKRHEVIGLQLQHEVEIFDTSVIITHLCTQQSTVVMTKEIIGIEVEGRIIVGHRPSEIVLIITCQRTVDIVARMFRQQMDALAQELLSILPFLSGQTDDSPLCPDATIVWIKLKAFVERLHGFRRVLLQQIDLCLHRIGTGIF